MSKQLPNRQTPLLTDGKRPTNPPPPRRQKTSIATIFGLTFMFLLICSIVSVGLLLVFPEITRVIRTVAGFPVETPQATVVDNRNIQLTLQTVGMTQTAMAQNPSSPAVLFTPTIYPTYTIYPTFTTHPSDTPYPTYTLYPDNTIQPTYTPYPAPNTQSNIPLLVTPTWTTEPNLIFQDSFDTSIDTGHWQTFGTWIIGKDGSNGYPLLLEKYKSPDDNTERAFYVGGRGGGLIFPGTSQMDNIAIEFDEKSTESMRFILSYQDELTYKFVYISGNNISFYFISNGKSTSIPQSSVSYSPNGNFDHFRFEIRGNGLSIYINGDLKYEVRDLPEKVTGAVGFVSYSGYYIFDNFKIYQLP